MNIYFDHVDWSSTAGPHWFDRKLGQVLRERGHYLTKMSAEIQLAFVMATQKINGVPLIQRLDGIWYDTTKDYVGMNAPIRATYDVADGVVFQSEWSKQLGESQFGPTDNYTIIHNGTLIEEIEGTPPAEGLDAYEKLWSCAAEWFYEDGTPRHIKRLYVNIRYFYEHSGEKDILCVAGDIKNNDGLEKQDRVIFLGHLGLRDLMSLYKRSDYFIHLGKFDNCPNVVVDARAAGCQIICSSLGGTQEIAGTDAIVIEEDEWDFVPFDYNVLSSLDFSRKIKNTYDKDISMDFVADKYLKFFKEFKV